MPLDISHLTVKANLKGKKAKQGNEKDAMKRFANSQAQTLKKVQQMLADLVPMVRDDVHDRLNR
jgi:hypothetical protein